MGSVNAGEQLLSMAKRREKEGFWKKLDIQARSRLERKKKHTLFVETRKRTVS